MFLYEENIVTRKFQAYWASLNIWKRLWKFSLQFRKITERDAQNTSVLSKTHKYCKSQNGEHDDVIKPNMKNNISINKLQTHVFLVITLSLHYLFYHRENIV